LGFWIAGWDVVEGGVAKLAPTIITCSGLAESPSKPLGSGESSNREVLWTGGAEVSVATVACCCTFPSIFENEDNTAACPGEIGGRQVLWWFDVEPLSCVVRLLRGGILIILDLHVQVENLELVPGGAKLVIAAAALRLWDCYVVRALC
jgi:hypothetical protein